MKNKKLIYILVPAVLIIWLMVIFRIAGYVNASDSEDYFTGNIYQEEPSKNEKDTFSILADYRDPFLGSSARFYKAEEIFTEDEPRVQETKPKPVPATDNKTTIKSIKWPDLEFGGLILQESTKQVVGLMKINNKEFLIRAEDSFLGVTIDKIYKDSVEVEFLDEKKTIYRK